MWKYKKPLFHKHGSESTPDGSKILSGSALQAWPEQLTPVWLVPAASKVINSCFLEFMSFKIRLAQN